MVGRGQVWSPAGPQNERRQRNTPVRSAAAPTVFYSAFYSKGDVFYVVYFIFIAVDIIAMTNHGLFDYCS